MSGGPPSKPAGSQGQVSRDAAYRGPELLIDLVDHLAHTLAESGIPADQARAASVEAVKQVAKVHGGNRVWIPRPMPGRSSLSWFDISARDLEVFRMLRRGNMAEVCARFGLQPSAVWKIVSRVRVERRAQLAALGLSHLGAANAPIQGSLMPGARPLP